MRQIALYGKGGIGKSTVASNVTAGLASLGTQVLQMGCDPKRDSTRAHLRGQAQRTVLEVIRKVGSYRNAVRQFTLDEFVVVADNGVHCVEAGGPEPGVGCAGRGIIAAMETLTELGLYEQGYDVIVYDVLGDVVCGGFAMPIRQGFAEEIYLVVSGEFLALYAANNICRGIVRYAAGGKARVAGVIGNLRDVPNERAIITAFAERIGSQVTTFIPHSTVVTAAENARRTVSEHAPDSEQATVYMDLARAVLAPQKLVVPAPLEDSDLEALVFDLRSKA